MKYTEQYEALPQIAKILLSLFAGGIVGGIYRILRYTETKNTTTLIIGVLCFVLIGGIIGIIDLITEIMYNRITVLAD